MKTMNNVKKTKIITTMNDWLNPITDRTELDIQLARNVISEARRTGKWPVDENNDPINLRGCLNYSDLNRIESNIVYLAQRINELTGIEVNIQNPKTTWTMLDVFTFVDFIKILKNLKILHIAMDLEPLDLGEENLDDLKPKDLEIDYEIINFIEEWQCKLHDLLTRVEIINIYSGAFNEEPYTTHIKVGQEDILPISDFIKEKLKEKRNEKKIQKKNYQRPCSN